MIGHPYGTPRTNQGEAELPQTLTESVQERVNNARHVLNRRANATRPKSKRQGRARPASSRNSPSLEEVRESQSLRRVFRDFGLSYRRYRSQTGARVPPGLRDAAYAFRAAPSLTSLVAVAAFLEKLDLLS
jgi:hypothetical protein